MAVSVRVCWSFLLLLGFFFPNWVSAHEIRPTIADVQLLSDSTVTVHIEVNLEALLAEVGPKHKNSQDSPNAARYDALRKAAPHIIQSEFKAFSARYIEGVHLSFDEKETVLSVVKVQVPSVGDHRKARQSVIHLQGQIPRGVHQARISYAPEFGNIAVKFRHNDDEAASVHWLTKGKLSPTFDLNAEVVPQPWTKVIIAYLTLGFEHIVPKGLDHILFVLGLFLLSTQMRPLLSQVTVFTLAHSITLGLSIYGLVALSPTIVEPLIALSIAYVGIENIVRSKISASRLLLIFAFGLLHGLGFAGVLADIGLPRADFLTALITFNLGVELGQLSVICVAMLLVVLLGLKGHARYRQWVVIPGSIVISLMGLYWFIQRLGLV